MKGTKAAGIWIDSHRTDSKKNTAWDAKEVYSLACGSRADASIDKIDFIS